MSPPNFTALTRRADGGGCARRTQRTRVCARVHPLFMARGAPSVHTSALEIASRARTRSAAGRRMRAWRRRPARELRLPRRVGAWRRVWHTPALRGTLCRTSKEARLADVARLCASNARVALALLRAPLKARTHYAGNKSAFAMRYLGARRAASRGMTANAHLQLSRASAQGTGRARDRRRPRRRQLCAVWRVAVNCNRTRAESGAAPSASR